MLIKKLWAPEIRPDNVRLEKTYAVPVTHVASHSLVGINEILPSWNHHVTALDPEDDQGFEYRKISAIGYGIEGTLLPNKEEIIATETLDWLETQNSMHNLGRFAVTNCRNSDKVELWIQQLSDVGIKVFSPHVVRKNRSTNNTDSAAKMPSAKLLTRALGYVNGRADEAIFISTNLKGIQAAKSADFIMRVLAPRMGRRDLGLVALPSRLEQRLFMSGFGLKFPEQISAETESQNV